MATGYQGYPYLNPIVTDVPSVDAATASKWTHLPKKVLSPPGPGPSSSGNSNNANLPSSSGYHRPPKQGYNKPVQHFVPENSGSTGYQSFKPPRDPPELTQETALYDPFQNKWIDQSMPESPVEQPTVPDLPTAQSSISQANRPYTQDSTSPGTSSSQLINTASRPGLPAFLEKESFVYGGQGSDGFPTPIPISEFPKPPPAYTEVAETPVQSAVVEEQPRPIPAPPKTQVIVPTDPVTPVGAMSYDRKLLTCQHCSSRVHTLVVKETSSPLCCFGYFSDCCKNKNHYCPNCNRLIGYERPFYGGEISLVGV